MSWWTITHLDNDRAQTVLAVLAETNHPAHLFMAWATVKPASRPIYRVVRGKRVFCGYKYIWDTPNLVEQSEPLDTFAHIFVTTPLRSHDHVWYYLFSQRTLYQRRSQSPLIHVPPPEIEMASARLSHSLNQTIPAAGSTNLAFNFEVWDDYNFHDPADPTKINIPVGALYAVGASFTMDLVPPTHAYVRILLNGASAWCEHQHSVAVGGPAGTMFSLTTMLALQPGDFLQLRLSHGSAGNQIVFGQPPFRPSFWIRLVGAYPL